MVRVRGPLLLTIGLAASPTCCALRPPPSLSRTAGGSASAIRSSHVRYGKRLRTRTKYCCIYRRCTTWRELSQQARWRVELSCFRSCGF